MKTLKIMLALFAMTIFAGTYAQTDNKEEVSQTKINKFKVKSTQGVIDYTVAINTTATDYVKMDNLSKKEQTRVKSENNVTTTIMVDNDVDNMYDNTITLRYKAPEDDTVKVIPTAAGFDIMVAGETLNYNFLKQVCNTPEGCPIDVQLSSNNM